MAIETELGAPTLLIAVPQLGDPNFARSVILVLEHNDEGSMGLVINRSSDLSMEEFCDSQDMKFRGDGSLAVHHGGPVQTDRAFILHASKHRGPETEEVCDAIRLSYSLESLRLLVDDPPRRMRVFLGYAGWGAGQLAAEVTAGAWLLARPTSRLIFDASPEHVWEAALRDLGIEPVQLVHSGAVH